MLRILSDLPRDNARRLAGFDEIADDQSRFEFGCNLVIGLVRPWRGGKLVEYLAAASLSPASRRKVAQLMPG